MEEYLQNMKTLRSQMNDFEEQAANISVEEQKQKTEIQTLKSDLESAKSESRRFKEEADEILKMKGQICCQIVEKQKQILDLEAESSTLSQTLELMQKEKVNLSEKIREKNAYYARVLEDMNAKFQEQEDWVIGHTLNKEKDLLKVVDTDESQLGQSERAEIMAMDRDSLEAEHKVLLSNKARVMDYLQSLEDRIQELKNFSSEIQCSCGNKYLVNLSGYFN